MQGRTAVLGLAAVLTLTLASCGVRSEADRGTETGRLRSSQAEQDMVRNGRTMLEDGSYYAGTDGAASGQSMRVSGKSWAETCGTAGTI